MHATDLVSQHDILRTTVLFWRESAKQLVLFDVYVVPDSPLGGGDSRLHSSSALGPSQGHYLSLLLGEHRVQDLVAFVALLQLV